MSISDSVVPGLPPGFRGSRTNGSALLEALGLTRQAEPEDSWQDEALCAEVDPEMFFPEKGGSTKKAKEVCAACTVRIECLQFAMDRDERFGIYGGLSERERRRLRWRAA
jgi:WhiB family redox-sensing transcriptional regulator